MKTDFDAEAARQNARWGISKLVRRFALAPAPEGSAGVCMCPACREGVVMARADDRGGRCRACKTGFTPVGLLRAAHGLTFHEAILDMRRNDPDGAPDQKTGVLL